MASVSIVLFYCAFFVSIFVSQLLDVRGLQCKNENNQSVDWFVLYKLPRIQDSVNPLIKEGVAYVYMDSKNFDKGWILSKKDITTNDSIPAYTLSPFYDDKNSQDLLWLLYSDQAPNKEAKFDNGHTKGALIANEKEGFWLIHSVPNFPPEPNTGKEVQSTNYKVNNTENVKIIEQPIGGYAYPSSGKVNGQSFLCISTVQPSFNTIGKQLMYNQILVYRKNTPSSLADKYPVLTDAAKQVRIKKAPFNNRVNIYSSNGMEFTSFAKSSKWQKDLYDDFVAPQLETDLYAETWLNGRGKLPSECNKTRVMNIQSISLSKADVQFKSSHDHSKWAVSVDGKKKGSWVCIGDINRAETQFDRGGGTVCLNLPEVWENYRNAVNDVEPCPKTKPKGLLGKVKSWFG